jgi:hypothetical protein
MLMVEISEIKKRVRLMIDHSRRTAVERRTRVASETRVGEQVLRQLVAPVFKSVAAALKAEGYLFRVSTPVDAVRMSAEAFGDNFIELVFDTTSVQSALRGRVSRLRGSRLLVEERVVSEGPELGTLTEEEVLEFLLGELRQFVE